MNCEKCDVEAEVVDVGSASGRKSFRCPGCGATWREKNAAAVALGSLGGKARAEAMSPEDRAAQATKAVTTRWDTEKTRDNPIVAGAKGILSGKYFGSRAK